MITINQIRLPLSCTKEQAIQKALKTIKINPADVDFADIHKISVDARKKPPMLVYSIAVQLKNEKVFNISSIFSSNVQITNKLPNFTLQPAKTDIRPVICGFGPAGIFCALALSRAGYKPIVLERGAEIEQRVKAIETFEENGEFNPSSNYQFGEGGAGTFSDGKLTTRINSHFCKYVIDELIKHGAPNEIAIKQKPHVGSDILRDIIVNIRKEILKNGAQIKFNTKLEQIITKNGKISAVKTNEGIIECQTLVLAMGHSARDTFTMLNESGMTLSPKPFSVGFRIEHLQKNLEQSLYHDAAGHPALPHGEYQLSKQINGRGVYTFCMCPGGVVVPATSEENAVVTNGMSYHSRNGKNANSAVVVSVNPHDFNNNAFEAIKFQQKLEQSAFIAGGKNYYAPAQDVNSFLNSQNSLKITDVTPTYSIGVTPYNIAKLLPEELSNCLKNALLSFDTKIKGFASPGAIITGLETRTSCPLRLQRDENGQSVDIMGIFPCGEGAGYAGGIMSAAVDGLKTAQNIANSINYM